MFRVSRGRSDGDGFFAIKAVLLAVGAGLGIAGMAYDVSVLVWAAIGVLAVAVILRVVGRRRAR